MYFITLIRYGIGSGLFTHVSMLAISYNVALIKKKTAYQEFTVISRI